MANSGAITNPTIDKLMQVIKNASDNEVILFDETEQYFSSRGIYTHKVIVFFKNLIYQLARLIKTTKLNRVLAYLDYKLYLADAAVCYLKSMNIGKFMHGELPYVSRYMVKEIKSAIIRLKKTKSSKYSNVKTSIFARTVRNTYFNFDRYKQDYNDYSNKIKQYINLIFADKVNLEYKNAKSMTACAIDFFQNKGLEISNNAELISVFERELALIINNCKSSSMATTKLSMFANSSLLPLILKTCVQKKIDICAYLNNMPCSDMKYWDNHLALQEIATLTDSNIKNNNLDKSYFADLLLEAIENITHSGINPVLNLLYSGMDILRSLTSIGARKFYKLLELLIRSNKKHKIEYIEYILKCSGNLENIKYINKMLFLAVSYDNNLSFIRKLINKGANINQLAHTKRKDTLLMIAIKSQKHEIAEELIKNNVDLNKKDALGCTALSNAVRTNNLYLVNLLIEKGADINSQTIMKDSLLIDAVFNNDLDISQVLIENGVGVNSQNIEGDTALIQAAKLNRIDIIKQLIRYNVDLDLQNSNGDTALIAAIRRNNIEVSKILVAAGADTNLKNKDNQTALTVAEGNNIRNAISLFAISD